MPPTPGGRRLATVTIPAPDLRPEPFLRHAAGEARGFWAREERWVAHRGVVAEIREDASGSADRYDAVEEEARALVQEPILPGRAARAPRIRFYGGFSFRTDHAAEDVWSAFPSALFQVPAFELEGDGSGDAWLRARALVSVEDADDALVRLRRTAESLRDDPGAR